MTVNLTRIYTKLGDGGETHLGDMSRVPKTHPRIEAYGDVDELNAQIGVALTVQGLPERYAGWLRRVQNDLFDVGADLSVPADAPPTKQGERLRVGADQVTWLEGACDEVNATLQPLKSFVLPGGNPAAAQLHVCRTVCRRAERRTLLVEDANPEVVRYLNRLSDLLFILSRGANDGDEPLWQPGRSRGEPTDGDEIRMLLASLPPQAFWAQPGEVAILERKVVEAGGDPDTVLAWVKAHGGRLDRTVPAAMRSAYSKLPISEPQRYYVVPADALADDPAA